MFGTVKWYNENKGYGFIKPDEADDDVFVHVTAVELSEFETLVAEQRLAFDVIIGRKGKPEAGRLRRVDG